LSHKDECGRSGDKSKYDESNGENRVLPKLIYQQAPPLRSMADGSIALMQVGVCREVDRLRAPSGRIKPGTSAHAQPALLINSPATSDSKPKGIIMPDGTVMSVMSTA
jgi:hypothetical protein